ncbi:hypothetical protein PtA15_4A314 [Puccinia triticina]|uniref:Uncharacterized protein n=1 Tax=Puccinia triticina TaxID=208348 RepID=A0ABY7CGI3_9BASI|nr:uncharacterized protein PtA15_4A314 [Puccinia triticina]WAQ83865.1 hypothetical protein PtA15_4A314 [Puccinia triticina]
MLISVDFMNGNLNNTCGSGVGGCIASETFPGPDTLTTPHYLFTSASLLLLCERWSTTNSSELSRSSTGIEPTRCTMNSTSPVPSGDHAFPSGQQSLTTDGKPWSQRTWSYQFIPCRGIYFDLKRRIPLYSCEESLCFSCLFAQ